MLRPPPLSVAAVAELARRALGAEPAPEFVDSCAEATGGNAVPHHRAAAAAGRGRHGAVGAPRRRVDEMAPRRVGDRITGWLAALPRARRRGRAIPCRARGGRAPAPGPACRGRGRRGPRRLPSSRAGRAARGLRPAAFRPSPRRPGGGDARSRPASDPSAISRRRGCCSKPGPRWTRAPCTCSPRDPRPTSGSASLLGRAARAALTRGAPAEAIGYLKRALAEPPPPSAGRRCCSNSAAPRSGCATPPTLRRPCGRVSPWTRRPPSAASLATTLSHAHYLAGEPDAGARGPGGAAQRRGGRRRKLTLDGNAISLGLLDPNDASGCAPGCTPTASARPRAGRGSAAWTRWPAPSTSSGPSRGAGHRPRAPRL